MVKWLSISFKLGISHISMLDHSLEIVAGPVYVEICILSEIKQRSLYNNVFASRVDESNNMQKLLMLS